MASNYLSSICEFVSCNFDIIAFDILRSVFLKEVKNYEEKKEIK